MTPAGGEGARLGIRMAVGAAAGVALLMLLWPFLPALVTASVLALILMPVHQRVAGALRRPGLAAGLSTALGILGLVAPLYLLGRVALGEMAGAAEWARSMGPAALRSVPALQSTLDLWLERLGVEGLEAGAAVATWVRGAPEFLMGRAFGLLAGVGGLAVQTGVAFFTLFFLLRDSDRLLELAHRLTPLDTADTGALLTRARQVISAVVYGNLFVAALQGTLGGLAFLALGLPAPAVWGALMAAASLVPLVGPGVIWLPTGLLLLVTGSPVRGALLLGFGVLVISTVDNVMRAVFVGSRARLHPMVVFLGVLGGIVLFGAVGVFVGPVLLALSLLYLEMARSAVYPAPTDPRP
ncbi:MAG: hypothetical protein AMXMBFR53_29160 [Gemmatimonadota bacterium]